MMGVAKPNHRATFHHRSRFLRAVKFVLPLLAVAILSSLFLFSQPITLGGALPFADIDLADRLREPKMTDVRLASTTDKGAELALTADAVVPTSTTQTIARNAKGTITPLNGNATTFTAPQISYTEDTALATLTGGVQITSADYTMTTEAMDVQINAAKLQSRSPVSAKGPLGTLQAGGHDCARKRWGAISVLQFGGSVGILTQIGLALWAITGGMNAHFHPCIGLAYWSLSPRLGAANGQRFSQFWRDQGRSKTARHRHIANPKR
jgi:lipopolysaccharide export system protein LptC